MAGISSKALSFGNPENKFKYNGIENENDLQIEIYDAPLRELDGQVGIWWQIDPKTENMEMWSPYASNYDNPLRYSDPLGDEGQECCLSGLFNWAPKLIDRVIDNWGTYLAEAKDVKNQLKENAINNWEARNDFFHQTIDNPMSLVVGPVGEFNVLNGVVRTENTLLRTELNTIVKTEASQGGEQVAMKIEQEAVQSRRSQKPVTPSKVEKSTTVEKIGDFTKKTRVEPSKKSPGQSRAEYVTIKNKEGKTIKTYKDSYDRGNKFQNGKPLRGGPEGRPQ